MKFKNHIIFVIVLLISSCSTSLTKEGEKVRVISESQKGNCEFIKLVTVQVSLGPDKLGSALKAALNEAGSVGANSFHIINNVVHWADGASVSGEALKCK